MNGLISGLEKAASNAATQQIENDRKADKARRKQEADDAYEARRDARITPHAMRLLDTLGQKFKESEDLTDKYQAQLGKIIAIIEALPNAPITVTRKDSGSYQPIIAALKENPQYLVRGTSSMDQADFHAAREDFHAKTGTSLPHFIRSFDRDDIDKKLSQIFKEHTIVIDFTCKKAPKNKRSSFDGDVSLLRIAFIGATKEFPTQAAISTTDKEWQVPRYGSKLTDKSFAAALADLGQWVAAECPTHAAPFIEACNALKEQEKTRLQHLTIYGHTRYLERAQDDLQGRRDDLDERIAVLQAQTEKRYGWLKEPQNEPQSQAPQSPQNAVPAPSTPATTPSVEATATFPKASLVPPAPIQAQVQEQNPQRAELWQQIAALQAPLKPRHDALNFLEPVKKPKGIFKR